MDLGVEIEFYPAGENVLLILTGIGGTTKGYLNKYQTIAENAVKNHGFSTCVATTPHGSWEHPEQNLRFITDYLAGKMKEGGKIYAMGSSAGASILLWYAHLYPKIVRVLAVNPVLNINLHRANDGIKNFAGEKIEIAVGENDASGFFCKMLKGSSRMNITRLSGVDHRFTDEMPLFISLPDRFLFD